jgi:hypothetical protein
MYHSDVDGFIDPFLSYQVEQVLLVVMFLRFYTVIRYLREREAVQVHHGRPLLSWPNQRAFLVHSRADAPLQKPVERLRHVCVYKNAGETIHQFAPVSIRYDGVCAELHHQHLLFANE